MKYLALLAAAAVLYYVLARQAPLEQVKDAVAQSEAAPLTQGPRDPAPATATALKRPITRTQEVLVSVKARNGDGEF